MTYKLIKKYPGSPELGYITDFNQYGEDWNTPNMLLTEDCDNYPEFWQKVKKLVFTTEDGVEMFENDRTFFVRLDSWKIYSIPVVKSVGTNPKCKYFSSKETAEKYVYDNKPVFSRKELTDFTSKNAKSEELDTYFCTAWVDAEELFNFINTKKE